MRERGACCRYTGNLGPYWIWQHFNILCLCIQILPFPPHPIELLGCQSRGLALSRSQLTKTAALQ